MCTLLIAWQADPSYPLILAANRDEFYERPTATAARWHDASGVFAGRDLVHGGTWLGVTVTGRIAALTNYREPHHAKPERPSRGHLVSDFLEGDLGAAQYLAAVRGSGGDYDGYNILLGDLAQLYYYSNRSDRMMPLSPGIHGLSNHLLDTPWPKVVRGKQALAGLIGAGPPSSEGLFAILADRTKAPDAELPETGVGLELERLLSSIFIESARYGTRSSTVLLVDRYRQATFIERSFHPCGATDTIARFDWSAS
jgi:uncharacterized protein with NRDE domain